MPARRATDVEVEGPFGTKIKFYGRQLTSFLFMAAVVIGVGYLIHQHDVNAVEAMTKIQSNQQILAEHMDEMIYVISLSEKDREKLNISMPPSLRNKIK
jgi:hypothetical protein